MAYLLSNICTKNYWNWTTIVEIIVGGWVVSFFKTQCRYCTEAACNVCCRWYSWWDILQCVLLCNVTGVQWWPLSSRSENWWWMRRTQHQLPLKQPVLIATPSSG